MMCEYCDVNLSRSLIYANANMEEGNNRKLVVDIKQGSGRWTLNAIVDTPHVYYGGEREINYCPMCGRELSEVDDG